MTKKHRKKSEAPEAHFVRKGAVGDTSQSVATLDWCSPSGVEFIQRVERSWARAAPLAVWGCSRWLARRPKIQRSRPEPAGIAPCKEKSCHLPGATMAALSLLLH